MVQLFTEEEMKIIVDSYNQDFSLMPSDIATKLGHELNLKQIHGLYIIKYQTKQSRKKAAGKLAIEEGKFSYHELAAIKRQKKLPLEMHIKAVVFLRENPNTTTEELINHCNAITTHDIYYLKTMLYGRRQDARRRKTKHSTAKSVNSINRVNAKSKETSWIPREVFIINGNVPANDMTELELAAIRSLAEEQNKTSTTKIVEVLNPVHCFELRETMREMSMQPT